MSFYAVEYSYSPSTAEPRANQRPEHLAWLQEHEKAGNLLASGRYATDSGALLIWKAQDESALRGLLDQDPYAHSQLIHALRIEEWLPTLGPFDSSGSA
ncbi:YciI family protein [Acaricomes phytoseiuli]|uniref:YciI family protein n=1 Tax=Acaricomes phytoseiuli TaxID=291968 RepID=UPI0022218456|nr:YciI family protein [Acaricomes phytoseiuli]MCW1249818.1 YciI family protein [Acaricomes phytoseiuli]